MIPKQNKLSSNYTMHELTNETKKMEMPNNYQ